MLVGALEGARPVPLQRALRKQLKPAGDQLGATAGRVARGPARTLEPKMQAARRGEDDEERERDEGAGRIKRGAERPAPGGEHRESEQEGDDAGLREAGDEPG